MLLTCVFSMAYIQGKSWGCMIAISCTSSLLSESVMFSLDFGVNLSTHKIQLPQEPDLAATTLRVLHDAA